MPVRRRTQYAAGGVLTSLLDSFSTRAGKPGILRPMTGHVMNFRLRPPKRMFFLALLILAAGAGIAAYYLGDDRRFLPNSRANANLAIAMSSVIAGCVVIVATAKLWFGHLWHKRRH